VRACVRERAREGEKERERESARARVRVRVCARVCARTYTYISIKVSRAILLDVIIAGKKERKISISIKITFSSSFI